MALVVKNPPANAEDLSDVCSIPGLGRSPGCGSPLQYSCLENLHGRGAWWATVLRVAKGRIQLKRLSTHALEGQKWLKGVRVLISVEWRINRICSWISCRCEKER